MAQAARIQTLIVDGEPLACEKIRQMVRDDPQIAVVGEYANLGEAASAIELRAPDLLFLDVQRPDASDLAALLTLEPERLPLIVFTTAYDRYAVRAFEARALDFLLKPFDRERFNLVLRRAVSHLSQNRGDRERGRRVMAAVRELRSRPPRPDTLERMLNPFISLRRPPHRWAQA